MILNGRGQLIWFRPVKAYATSLQVQRYRGQPVLTWWQRVPPGGGEDVILDRSYRRIATLHAANGYLADLHELQLTSRRTALIDAYVPVKFNLRRIGGSSTATVYDCVIQELDVKTGKLLWEWHALGHVPLNASYIGQPTASPYDYFHLNSIQQLPDGNLLVSARHTWAVYELDKQTGKVIWTLGGKDSSFRIPPPARFEWQHDARLHPGGILTLFDNASNDVTQQESQSSAESIKLSMSDMTATLRRRYRHSPPLITGAEGNAQLLPNNDVFVGWGQQPDFSEYAPDGRQIFNGSFALPVRSYRAFRFPWRGQPPTRPSLAFSPPSNGSVKAYASWNGATRVATWRVLAGSRPSALHPISQARRTGFETVTILHRRLRYIVVQALNANGKVLGRSSIRAVSYR